MLRQTLVVLSCATVLGMANPASADTFGVGDNQFTIDFVVISGDASSANGTNISQFSSGDSGHKTFTDPGNDYRMGVCEITNGQWDKFKASLLPVVVTGDPTDAYDNDPYFAGADIPTNEVSWYEAAQFVNWLNTSAGHHAAYKFTGTQGTSGYALDTWSVTEADNGTNLYRHKDAVYYMPTEDEWVKAAYWNGTGLQTYATKDNTTPDEWRPTGGPNSDGQAAGWNYGYAYPDNSSSTAQPWDVTGGHSPEELNGTFDMMGNIFEWMEGPYSDTGYGTGTDRALRGGSYGNFDDYSLRSIYRRVNSPSVEYDNTGFRVASEALEPPTPSVGIDIKPGSDPNPINLGSRGVVPVAILTTPDFDATTVDPETVQLAGASVATRGKANRRLANEEDVDDDGDLDLVLHFETQDLVLQTDATTAVLTGQTYDGTEIEGSDSIVIVPKREVSFDLVVSDTTLTVPEAGMAEIYAANTTITPSADTEITATHGQYWLGDISQDLLVSGSDLDIILGEWDHAGTEIINPLADVNDDGFVGDKDLDVVLAQWGNTGFQP